MWQNSLKMDDSWDKWRHFKIQLDPASLLALQGFKHLSSCVSVQNQLLLPGPHIRNENVRLCNPRTWAIGGPWEETIKYSKTATHRLQVFVLTSCFMFLLVPVCMWCGVTGRLLNSLLSYRSDCLGRLYCLWVLNIYCSPQGPNAKILTPEVTYPFTKIRRKCLV